MKRGTLINLFHKVIEKEFGYDNSMGDYNHRTYDYIESKGLAKDFIKTIRAELKKERDECD